MIGVINVKVNSAKPNMPLCPCFAFKDSPSSLRILDVPKQIGSWRITEVFAMFHYPDDVVKTKSAVREGNVWVATVEGCSTSGKVTNGLTIAANGIDEDGNAVNGYVLGIGDIYVMNRDDSIAPDPSTDKFYVRYCDSQPSNPTKGDAYVQGYMLNIYNGTSWVPACDISALESQIALKRDFTDFNVYARPNSTTTIYVGTTPCEWNESSQRWESLYGDAYVTPPESQQSNIYFVFVAGVGDDVELAPPNYRGIFHGDYSDLEVRCSASDSIAKVSQLPTKTSDLTNDSGFITVEEVPTPNEIQDNSGNVIRANRTVNYIGDTDKWTVNIDSQEYVLIGEKGDAAYVPENPQSGDKKYTLNWSVLDGMWFLKYYTWTDGTWDQTDSFSSYDTYGATFLEFNGGEGQTASWGVVLESGELALKSYVDEQIGQVLTEEF